VTQQKKYVEITQLIPNTTGCPGGTVVFSEGLKAFFGPACVISFSAIGIINIKPANCSNEPLTGTPAPSEFGAGAVYICDNSILAVKFNTDLATPPLLVPITVTATGLGPSTGVTFVSNGATFCVGGTLPAGGIPTTTGAVGAVTLCPTSFGAASVTACVASSINTQPPVACSTTNLTFTLPSAGRVVPYVRWAGEKTVLTKCFGGAGLMAHALVEFTLNGNNPGLNATLLPTALFAGLGPSGGNIIGIQNTVFATTDANGCASVILLASGEGVAYVDAALYSSIPLTGGLGTPLINEHAFEVFYLKFNNVALENISPTGNTVTTSTALPELGFLASIAPTNLNGALTNTTVPATISMPTLPGQGAQAGGAFPIPLCQPDLMRAMVHGYFEISGDPSGRPASTVTIPGAPAGASGSFTLPAGRWVLPEDWPVLATFAGFASAGTPVTGGGNPASVYAWDLNSGFAFDQTEPAVLCGMLGPAPSLTSTGAIPMSDVNTGPCFGGDFLGVASGTGTPSNGYSTAPAGPNCTAGLTVGIGPFDATQACTNPFPLPYSPAGSGRLTLISTGATGATFGVVPAGPNSTYLPNGFLSQWDAPMPPAQVTFGITSGPGFLDQVNKSAVYSFNVPINGTSNPVLYNSVYYDPFYAEAIPASPLIPPVTNNGGYLWDSWGFSAGGTTTVAATINLTTATATSSAIASTSPTTLPCTGTITVTLTTAADAANFTAGQTVTVAGATVATGTTSFSATVTASDAGAGTVSFSCSDIPAGVTSLVGATLTATTVPVTLLAAAPAGVNVVIECSSGTFTTIGTGSTTLFVSAGGLMSACGTTLAAGTLVFFGPAVATCGTGPCTTPGGLIIGAPSRPYPFWQWVPNPPSSAAGNTTATVYSDNHGEAMVSLETGITGQSVFVGTGLGANACVNAGLTNVGTVAWVYVPSTGFCILPLTALAQAGFQNVATALAGGAGTCFNTTTTGGISPAPTPAPSATIVPNGPTTGQICVNSLGNLEFGPTANVGTTTVQAVADYPYTRGEHPQVSSGSITKVWQSAFQKTVSVSPAVAGPAGTSTYTITITAKDICGNALLGEPINVFVFGNPGSVVLAGVGTTVVSQNGTTSATVTVGASGSTTLSLEVLSQAVGNNGVVVKVVFPIEGIERFATVIAPTTPTATVTQIYAPGYQQVGGPSGSNFGAAEAVFSYDSATNSYTNVSASSTALSSAPPACTGYWAYFAAPASATLPATSKPGDTATCNLAAGWNLVGNPFASAAALPSGTVAYHWNGTSYDVVGQIPLGGAVWIFNSGAATTITLTAT
jgi:hypothetical protein